VILLGVAGCVYRHVDWPLLPAKPVIAGLKAVSEASMVGALADWFAVSALFRRVPIPLVGRHTAIIPRNKDRIADNLALFVQDKFLNTESLLALIRRHDPAQIIARWLSSAENTARLSGYLLKMVRGFLDLAMTAYSGIHAPRHPQGDRQSGPRIGRDDPGKPDQK
jgi:uncharacterized membrane-anchored protein YjiN (DUF445 family)